MKRRLLISCKVITYQLMDGRRYPKVVIHLPPYIRICKGEMPLRRNDDASASVQTMSQV